MILVNGREISCFVEEMGIEVVKYRKCDNPTGPIYVISKRDVSLVKYPNGTTEFVKVEDLKRGSSSSTYSSNADSDRKLNAPAFIAFILSLVSLFLPVAPGVIGEVLAFILSLVGLSAISQNPDRFKGKGFGVAGLVISAIMLFLLAIALLK